MPLHVDLTAVGTRDRRGEFDDLAVLEHAPGGRPPDRTLVLSVRAPGRGGADPDGGATVVAIGRIVLSSSPGARRPGSGDVTTHTYVFGHDALRLPEHLLPRDRAHPVLAGHPLGPVVAAYLASLATHVTDLDPRRRAELEAPTLDLVRALLAPGATTTDAAGELHDPLGVRIVEYLRAHLTDRDLNVAAVARHHNISERYTYLILAKFGVTFSEWVRRHRLEGATADLLDPGSARDSISDIAFRWGFPDHANFTRAFRREHGQSPRDFRKGARAP